MSVGRKPVRAAIAHGNMILKKSSVQHSNCLVGAYCGHAILTERIGIYHCPFGECFKKLENQTPEAQEVLDD